MAEKRTWMQETFVKREDFDADKNRGMTSGGMVGQLSWSIIHLSDDPIRQAFNKCSRRVPKEIRPPKPLIMKRVVRGAGFEPARPFEH
jgi:hypothetical protein